MHVERLLRSCQETASRATEDFRQHEYKILHISYKGAIDCLRDQEKTPEQRQSCLSKAFGPTRKYFKGVATGWGPYATRLRICIGKCGHDHSSSCIGICLRSFGRSARRKLSDNRSNKFA